MSESTALTNGEQLRVCDANNRIVAVLLSPATLEQMNAERDRLVQEVGELRKQLDEAQRQIVVLDEDWHSMFRLLPRELQVTEEDIKEIQRDPHTFEELFREWEQK